MLGDADEVEVLLDVVCDLESELLLPGFDVVFGCEVVEEGAVGGCEVGGWGCHGCGMDVWKVCLLGSGMAFLLLGFACGYRLL